MSEKFIEDLKAEQQRIANEIVTLKTDIQQAHDRVESELTQKKTMIEERAGKLDVLKQVLDFYMKGATEAPTEPQQQQPEPQQVATEQEPQSVFTTEPEQPREG